MAKRRAKAPTALTAITATGLDVLTVGVPASAVPEGAIALNGDCLYDAVWRVGSSGVALLRRFDGAIITREGAELVYVVLAGGAQ
jgi:hypothetical protein